MSIENKHINKNSMLKNYIRIGNFNVQCMSLTAMVLIIGFSNLSILVVDISPNKRVANATFQPVKNRL